MGHGHGSALTYNFSVKMSGRLGNVSFAVHLFVSVCDFIERILFDHRMHIT